MNDGFVVPFHSKPATEAQKEYIESLVEKCGYDISDYDLDNLSSIEASRLIDDLKEDLY